MTIVPSVAKALPLRLLPSLQSEEAPSTAASGNASTDARIRRRTPAADAAAVAIASSSSQAPYSASSDNIADYIEFISAGCLWSQIRSKVSGWLVSHLLRRLQNNMLFAGALASQILSNSPPR